MLKKEEVDKVFLMLFLNKMIGKHRITVEDIKREMSMLKTEDFRSPSILSSKALPTAGQDAIFSNTSSLLSLKIHLGSLLRLLMKMWVISISVCRRRGNFTQKNR